MYGHFLDMDKNQVSMLFSQVSIIQDHIGMTPSILYAHKPLDYCLPRVAQTVRMLGNIKRKLFLLHLAYSRQLLYGSLATIRKTTDKYSAVTITRSSASTFVASAVSTREMAFVFV